MGTKGRDIAIWGLYLAPLTFIFMPPLIGAVFIMVPYMALILFQLQIRKAIFLRQVVLVPLWPWAARFWVKKRLQGNWNNAYEVHIRFNKQPKKIQVRAIAADLKDVLDVPGLYIWETHVSVPLNIRFVIRNLKQRNMAFWEPGIFLPRPPFIYHRAYRTIYRGAAVILDKEEMNEQEKGVCHCGVFNSSGSGNPAHKCAG